MLLRKYLPKDRRLKRARRGAWLAVVGVVSVVSSMLPAGTAPTAQAQSPSPVATFSAASYEPGVAPDSIAAAFGANLATGTQSAETMPLPLSLLGTRVTVTDSARVERPAPLFFVSPGQINYLVPTGTAAGAATVTIQSGDGATSTGALQVNAVAPAIFTANGNGNGVPAATLLRLRAGGERVDELIFEPDPNEEGFIPRAIDFGQGDDRLFVVLYLSGLRHAPDLRESVRLVIGGDEVAPGYAGPAPGFVGLDQINAELPRRLAGRQRLQLFVKVADAAASNVAVIDFATPETAAPPQVAGFDLDLVLAGQRVVISGSRFSSGARVRFISDQAPGDRSTPPEAQVLSVTPTQLTALVPFGAGSGRVSVATSGGEGQSAAPLAVRTSVSGFIEETQNQPGGGVRRLGIAGVRVRMRGNLGTERVTDERGSFVLPDVAAGDQEVEVIGSQAPLPYPDQKFKMTVRAGRDNEVGPPIELKAIGATSFPLSGEVGGEAQTAAGLTLTYLDPGRTPADLPPGHFSTRIVQLTPFGAPVTPGAKLSFPNADRIPAGAQARLFKFDQTPGSDKLGKFVDIGAATVTPDGQSVETGANAITEGSYYFVSLARPTATLYGHVVEQSDGRPVRRAVVRVRGQSTFTDGNGGFVLRQVPILGEGDQVMVEVSLLRPDGRVDRVDRGGVRVAAGGVTLVAPDLVLPRGSSNRPPAILAPAGLSLRAGEQRDFSFVVSDPDAGQTVQVELSGPGFATVSSTGNEVYALRLMPGAGAVGDYALTIKATDSLGAVTTQVIALKVTTQSGLTAHDQSVATDEDTGRAITLTGSGGGSPGYRVVSGPAHGTLSGSGANLTYTPAPNYNGTDSFTFRVSEGGAESGEGTVHIAIRPVNDAPVLTAVAPQRVEAGKILSFLVTAADVDAGDALNFTATPAKELPGVSFTPVSETSYEFRWMPLATQAGSYAVNFKVVDSGSPPLSDARSVTITVGAQFAKTSGLEGGRIRALLISGANLFAGSDGGGIFTSANNGRIWREVNTGLAGDGLRVNALADSGVGLFAGTLNGVYRSNDNGQNWIAVNQGLTNLSVYSLAVRGTTLFAGTGGGRVFRSTNQGQTWVAASDGLPPGPNVTALLASGTNLFAGFLGGGVYRSTDGGQTWAEANAGITNRSIFSLVVSGGNLFAGADGGGVYHSTDGGQTWAEVNTGLTSLLVYSLAVTEANLFAGTLGGGVYRSADNGQTWTEVNAGLVNRNVISLAAGGGNLFAGADGGGVYRSTDGGQTWAEVNTGLTAGNVYAIAVSENRLYAATYGGGVFRSADGGQSWVAINAGLTDLYVNDLAVKGTDLFAATDRSGVFRSSDDGQSWAKVNTGLNNTFVYSLAVSGANLFAGTNGGGVFRSSDGGQSWVAASTGLTNLRVYSLGVSGAGLLAGTLGGGIFRSTDNGQSWSQVNTGLTAAGMNVNAFAESGSTLFAGTGGGVFRSTDGGQSWVEANAGLTGSSLLVNALAVSGAGLFAGTGGGGVYRSTDGGQSWVPFNAGLANPVILSLAVSGSSLYVGDLGGSVSVLADHSQSWAAVNEGLANSSINALAVSGTAFLAAGTLGGGIFRSTDQGQSWASASEGLRPSANVQSVVLSGASVFAGTFGDGVFRSTNGGQRWAEVNTGLGNRFVNALAVSGAALFAATDGGVFRSVDGGQSWQEANRGLASRHVLALAVSGSRIYAGTDGGGVFVSFNLGQTWAASNAGLSSPDVRSFATGESALFAGTLSGGVYRSDNGGESWTRVNNGLPPRLPVFSLAARGTKVYAGTIYGAFVSNNRGADWKQVNAGLVDIYITSLALTGDMLLAGTRKGGVFLSQIPD